MTKSEGKKSEKKSGVANAARGAEVKKEKGEAKKVSRAKAPVVAMEPRLKKIYREQILPELFKEFGYSSKMQTPRLEKIVVNMGVGEYQL